MSGLLTLKDHFKENQLYLNRTVAATLVTLMMMGILVTRLVFLQVLQHDAYVTLARNNQMRIVPVVPTRGLIYDRHGQLLAENISTFSLEILPSRVKNLDDSINKLSKTIPISEGEIQNFKKQLKYKGPFDSIPIKVKLTEEEVARFSVVKYDHPEVEVVARLSRAYPEADYLSHVLGYLGPLSEQDVKEIDITQYRGTHQIGKLGIEKHYESILHGKVGFEQVETDVRGRVLRVLERHSPMPGQNLYLYLDHKLQKFAAEAFEDKTGALVALDPKTGGVLAMVSAPAYDNNLFVQGLDQEELQSLQRNPKRPLFNRAIGGQYPPGSTVKPIIALQALEKGVIKAHSSIYDPGYYQLNEEGRYFRDWKRGGHGFVNVESAITQSCTTYFYYLADKLGIDKLHEVFDQFGLGRQSGVDIYGEAAGIAPSPAWKKRVKKENWYAGETLNVGIGQGYTLATPLQIAQMAAAIANRGQLIHPKIVQTLGHSREESTIESPPDVSLNDFHADHWKVVVRGLEKVVRSPSGTAHRLYRPNGFKLAGKTGTAQVFSLKEDEKYEGNKLKKQLRDHSWFMAFAPADDPKIAIAVIVENDKGAPQLAYRVIESYLQGLSDDYS